MEKTSVACVCWIPQGVVDLHPKSYLFSNISPEEARKRLNKKKKKKIFDDEQECMIIDEGVNSNNSIYDDKNNKKKISSLSEKKNICQDDKNDDDIDTDEEENDDEWLNSSTEDENSNIENQLPNEQLFSNFILDAGNAWKDNNIRIDDIDSEDEEAITLRTTDHLVVSATAEVDFSSLEVYVFDPESCGLYVHHDITLGSFPLALEWIDRASTSEKKNFIASSTFESTIDIWNLDVIDCLEPFAQLKGVNTPKNPLNKKANKNDRNQIGVRKSNSDHNNLDNKNSDGHSCAVLSLHQNNSTGSENLFLSGSADETVKLWDLNTISAVSTLHHHTGKVQAVKWNNNNESSLFASAGFDKKLIISDCRDMKKLSCSTFLQSDVESLIWAQNNPYQILVSEENGTIESFDSRKMKNSLKPSPLWHFKAHKSAATSVNDCSKYNDMLITSSLDNTAKVWRITNEDIPQKLVYKKNMKAGSLYSASANKDDPLLFAFGGRELVIWNISESHDICKEFDIKQ